MDLVRVSGIVRVDLAIETLCVDIFLVGKQTIQITLIKITGTQLFLTKKGLHGLLAVARRSVHKGSCVPHGYSAYSLDFF